MAKCLFILPLLGRRDRFVFPSFHNLQNLHIFNILSFSSVFSLYVSPFLGQSETIISDFKRVKWKICNFFNKCSFLAYFRANLCKNGRFVGVFLSQKINFPVFWPILLIQRLFWCQIIFFLIWAIFLSLSRFKMFPQGVYWQSDSGMCYPRLLSSK